MKTMGKTLTLAHKKKLLAWLTSIGETDQEGIDQVLENCRADPKHTLEIFFPTIFSFYRSMNE
jgi:hypothetical protein